MITEAHVAAALLKFASQIVERWEDTPDNESGRELAELAISGMAEAGKLAPAREIPPPRIRKPKADPPRAAARTTAPDPDPETEAKP